MFMHKRLMAMKQTLASAIKTQLCNIGEVDCEELGCAIDMLKDLEEALYFCTITEAMNNEGKEKGNVEIEYEGHKKNGHSQMSGSDQMYYPMYADKGNGSQMYNMENMPIMYSDGGKTAGNSSGGSSYYGGPHGDWGNQPYYNGVEWICYGGNEPMYYQGRDSQGRFTSGRGNPRSSYSEPTMERDEREGRSYMNRKMYMEAKNTKDKASQLRELEKYMQELTSDMVEMIQDSSPEEKQYLEKKISALASKIGQMK
jgi:hypothetical protein